MTLADLCTWVDVGPLDRLPLDRGSCVLVAGCQVALFRLSPGLEVHALSNLDPLSDAYVLSRGIVGSRMGAPKVASPMYKQSFDLRTGACLDDPTVSVRVYPVRIDGGRVLLGVP